jgi:15-cis-phytoene synthase
MSEDAIVVCRRSLATHGHSFDLASKLLPRDRADRAAALYAFCRQLDDAIDLAPDGAIGHALEAAREAVDVAYGSAATRDPVIGAFRETVRATRIPRAYPDELVAGFAMDARGERYRDLAGLLQYCYRAAGVVGLMMCHVLGVRDRRALRHAAHLGIAMQLTNICRDVREDWERGRLYLPEEMLAAAGAPPLRPALGGTFPESARLAVAKVVEQLLWEADRYYASADRGLAHLSFRCAVGIRAARLLYAEIGARLRCAGCDPFAGRAVVPPLRRLALVARAVAGTSARSLFRWRVRFRAVALDSELRYPVDVLPV